jgi:hypothetical protein
MKGTESETIEPVENTKKPSMGLQEIDIILIGTELVCAAIACDPWMVLRSDGTENRRI